VSTGSPITITITITNHQSRAIYQQHPSMSTKFEKKEQKTGKGQKKP
jgi:hemoglobin-like flavoprotein